MKPLQKRLLQSLDHLTTKHGARTFNDLAATAGREQADVARETAWLIVNGYVKAYPNRVLEVTERGQEVLREWTKRESHSDRLSSSTTSESSRRQRRSS